MHVPERTCMGCNAKAEKGSLTRIVKTENGEVILDETGKLSGRGAYI